MPRRVSLFPFYLIQNRTDFSVPVQFNSNAKLCNRPRKALHLPTQSFASANAKLCICQRKALPSFRSPIPMFFPLSLICFSVTIVLGIKKIGFRPNVYCSYHIQAKTDMLGVRVVLLYLAIFFPSTMLMPFCRVVRRRPRTS